MSQHDLTIENQTFPLTRADLNLALKSLSECQSGTSAPTHLANGVLWLDTTADPNILKMYNSGAPSNWITIGEFAVSTGIFTTARLDGLTATVTELNKLDGVTATTAELNKLAGASATTAQLNFVTGVTSAIQAQLNDKAALASPALTGTPTTPTPVGTSNDTTIPTTAFVRSAITTYAPASGLEFIATANASATSVIDFTGFDASAYDSYVFMVGNLKTSATFATFQLRTSTDAGSTWDSGSSDYNDMISPDSAATTNAITISTLMNNTGSANGYSGTVTIYHPHLAYQTKVTGIGFGESQGLSLAGGFRDSTADVTGVRFMMNTGTMAYGSITMYGMRNA